MIRVEVRGVPSTKGSLRPGVSSRGKAFVREQMGDKLRTWREQLSSALTDAMDAAGPSPTPEPVAVFIVFRLPRPKRPAWPWPATRNRNDIDKLARCVLDHLSGVVIEDDGQVVFLATTKVYGDPGATIAVSRIATTGAAALDEGIASVLDPLAHAVVSA